MFKNAEPDHPSNYSPKYPVSVPIFNRFHIETVVIILLYCCVCVLYPDALFSSLIIVRLHTERWCTALGNWASVEVYPSVLGYHHCTYGFGIGWCNNAVSTFW